MKRQPWPHAIKAPKYGGIKIAIVALKEKGGAKSGAAAAAAAEARAAAGEEAVAAAGEVSTSEETLEETPEDTDTPPEDSHENDEHEIEDSHKAGGVAGVLSNMFGLGGGGGEESEETVVPSSPPAELSGAEIEAKENHVTGGDGGGGYAWER